MIYIVVTAVQIVIIPMYQVARVVLRMDYLLPPKENDPNLKALLRIELSTTILLLWLPITMNYVIAIGKMCLLLKMTIESLNLDLFLLKTGVCADITSNSTPLDCLFTLLTDDIMEDIVIVVNTYAIHKIQLNTPARRGSTYNDWKPTNRYELLKCIAVLIAMGLDHRSSIKD